MIKTDSESKHHTHEISSSLEMVFSDPSKPIQLSQFRNVLIRQEETIIFALIERAQFLRNEPAYRKGYDCPHIGEFKGKYQNFEGSYLDFMFSKTEELHALVRRYTSPDEHAFYPSSLPEPLLPRLNYPAVIKPNSININNQIKSLYLNKILPKITKEGEDSTSYGSTTTCDITALQALSKRIHFGKFIAEAKYQEAKEKYKNLILANDSKGIMEALTNLEVEKKVLQRVELKASTYGQDIDGSTSDFKVDPKLIAAIYQDFVMPLTKEVQVAYLLQRLDHPSVSFVGPVGSECHSAAIQQFGIESNRNFESCESVSSVFGNVMANHTALGIVPLENSKTGMVKETQSMLISSSLNMCGEIYCKTQYLLGYESSKEVHKAREILDLRSILNEFKYLVVPIDAEVICNEVFGEYDNIIKVVLVNTVEEAATHAKKDPSIIAFTSPNAANEMQLKVLNQKLKSKHTSRYAIISKYNADRSSCGKDKTCLWLRVKHETGGLLQALSVLKTHDVNMNNLESIPCEQNWKYDFFIEIDGHAEDENVSSSIEELKKTDCSVRCLGSYPAAD